MSPAEKWVHEQYKKERKVREQWIQNAIISKLRESTDDDAIAALMKRYSPMEVMDAHMTLVGEALA